MCSVEENIVIYTNNNWETSLHHKKFEPFVYSENIVDITAGEIMTVCVKERPLLANSYSNCIKFIARWSCLLQVGPKESRQNQSGDYKVTEGRNRGQKHLRGRVWLMPEKKTYTIILRVSAFS